MSAYHIIPKEHGYPLDHIGLALHDLDVGVRYIQDLHSIYERVDGWRDKAKRSKDIRG